MLAMGAVMILAGAGTWGAVAAQLGAERIVVPDDTPFLPGVTAGRTVTGPLTAAAQAEAIRRHSAAIPEELTGEPRFRGSTYAELGRAVSQADDAGQTELAARLAEARATVREGDLLRASLFTSVIAFGVAALLAGVGVMALATGWGLRRLG
jgi:hypothetical protein